jgi:hypothetical protein
VYFLASLAHFVHNAEYIAYYPNMPAWLTRAGVYLAWLALASLGLAGYLLTRRGYVRIGAAALAGSALMGLDSLGHYGLAPFSAHTAMMNATIVAEVSSAAVLLVAACAILVARHRKIRA